MIGIVAILLIILLGDAFLGNINEINQKRKRYCIAVFGAMLLFAGLRGPSVAIDTASRYSMFSTVCKMGFLDAFEYMRSLRNGSEIGYSFFISLISRILSTPYLLNLTLDLFVIITFAYFFYHYAEDLKIACLMYFSFAFSSSLNITRQYVAAAFFIWAVICIIRGKKIRSMLLIAIATSFHTSAVFLFAIYLLYLVNFRVTKKLLVLTTGISVAFFYFFDIVSFAVMQRFFPQYWWYLSGDWAVGNQEFSLLWLVIYSIMGIILFFELDDDASIDMQTETGYLSRYNQKQMVFGLATICFVIYALIAMLRSKVWILSRLGIYVGFGYYLSAGNMFNRLNIVNYRSRRLIRAIFILLLSIWCIMMYRTDGNRLFPYVFIWDSF